jgi:SAM-dependent methyltransferase
VLELGCGSGLPTTKWLAERFEVTAVDLSARHVKLARTNVPTARILQADMTRLELPPASVDAVIAFYSIIHVPREEHAGLLRAIATWLRPGGVAVLALGGRDLPAHYEDDWLGAPMFWSHFDAATNRALVEQAGLIIERATEEVADEDGLPITFLWVVTRKP